MNEKNRIDWQAHGKQPNRVELNLNEKYWLYKLAKLEVAESYFDHGYSLPEMWEILMGENKNGFWTCEVQCTYWAIQEKNEKDASYRGALRRRYYQVEKQLLYAIRNHKMYGALEVIESLNKEKENLKIWLKWSA